MDVAPVFSCTLPARGTVGTPCDDGCHDVRAPDPREHDAGRALFAAAFPRAEHLGGARRGGKGGCYQHKEVCRGDDDGDDESCVRHEERHRTHDEREHVPRHEQQFVQHGEQEQGAVRSPHAGEHDRPREREKPARRRNEERPAAHAGIGDAGRAHGHVYAGWQREEREPPCDAGPLLMVLMQLLRLDAHRLPLTSASAARQEREGLP